jgi:subtilisin family serine protease
MKKLIGIIIVLLLMVAAIPSFGMINETQSANKKKLDNYNDCRFVPGEFIVKFKEPPFSCVSVNNLNEKHQVTYMEKIFINSEDTILDNIYSFYVSEDADILSIVEEYNSISSVEYAEPNYIVKLCEIPNDPRFDLQWALHNTGQYDGTPDADIDAPEAWSIETGSSDVVIAIIDTGVDWDHPDLAANIWNNSYEKLDGNDTDENGFIDDIRGWDFVNDDNNPMDDNGHGTMCAGIASADTDNNVGMAGICWNCRIMPVKTLNSNGEGTWVVIADGVVYAVDNDAVVISMSLGGYSDVSLMKDVVDYAYSNGATLVAAAGNYASDEKFYPSAYDDVIAVAAIFNKNIKISASNYGSWVDVAAPGWKIYTTNLDDVYAFSGYTSSACPHVSGLAALLLSHDPTLSNKDIRKIIRANVDPYISEEYIGTGRVNAYKALTRFNTQPEIPETPTGKTNGRPGRCYSFITNATDEDGDELWYFWDWGDGTYSDWLGPYGSGAECEASYTWQQEANFSIKVKVKDGKGGESYWSDEFIFSTPRSKAINPFELLIERLIERFPLLEILLN